MSGWIAGHSVSEKINSVIRPARVSQQGLIEQVMIIPFSHGIG
jgi:hypothetical protein